MRAILNSIDYSGPELLLGWSDGLSCRHNIARLRQSCPCAECTEGSLREYVANESNLQNIMVKEARMIGNYALQLEFSDGHADGYYRLDRLRQACESNSPYSS